MLNNWLFAKLFMIESLNMINFGLFHPLYNKNLVYSFFSFKFLMWLFKNFEEVDIELAELRQRHNQALESMNKTVIPENPEADQSDVEEGKNDTEKRFWKITFVILFFHWPFYFFSIKSKSHTLENSGYVFLNWWEKFLFFSKNFLFPSILTNGWKLGQNRLIFKAPYSIS